MKTLFIECNMGAAGDTLTAALLELVEEPESFIKKINRINGYKVHITRKPKEKCGIIGTMVDVRTQNHVRMDDIEDFIHGMDVSDEVKCHALAICNIIKEAESHVYGRDDSQAYFHEIGASGAIIDIIGVCILMEALKPDQIIASPIHLGTGTVRRANGVLPIPTPTTAQILMGIPVYQGSVKGELCTPVGAAILKRFTNQFGQMPNMKIEKIGYGMGKRDFEEANCLRAFLGESLPSLSNQEQVKTEIGRMAGSNGFNIYDVIYRLRKEIEGSR